MRVIIPGKPHIALIRAAGSLCTITQPVDCNRPWTDLVSHSDRHQKNVFLSSVGNGETKCPELLPSTLVGHFSSETEVYQVSAKSEKNQFPDFQVFLNPTETVAEPGV